MKTKAGYIFYKAMKFIQSRQDIHIIETPDNNTVVWCLTTNTYQIYYKPGNKQKTIIKAVERIRNGFGF